MKIPFLPSQIFDYDWFGLRWPPEWLLTLREDETKVYTPLAQMGMTHSPWQNGLYMFYLEPF